MPDCDKTSATSSKVTQIVGQRGIDMAEVGVLQGLHRDRHG